MVLEPLLELVAVFLLGVAPALLSRVSPTIPQSILKEIWRFSTWGQEGQSMVSGNRSTGSVADEMLMRLSGRTGYLVEL
jgi:hypothetical protein